MTFGSSSIGCFDPFDIVQYTAEAAPVLGGPPIGQDRYELLVYLLCLLLLCVCFVSSLGSLQYFLTLPLVLVLVYTNTTNTDVDFVCAIQTHAPSVVYYY